MSQVIPQSQTLTINLKQAHTSAGLDKRDLQYLEAAPPVPKRSAMMYRGVFVE